MKYCNDSASKGPYLKRGKGSQRTNAERLQEETSLLKGAVELVVMIQTHPVPLLSQMLIKT
jgi:hypothetical protein